MLALTLALTTLFTWADGPVTRTVSGVTVTSPTTSPSGGCARSTTTGTSLDTFWSRLTWMDRGRHSRIVTLGSTPVTFTRTVVGLPSGSTSSRSTVARKSSASRRPTSAGAMYRICSTSLSWLVMTVLGGWFTAVTGTGPG